MRIANILFVVLLSFEPALPQSASTACAGENFSHAQMKDAEIFGELTSAVFRIQTSNSESGTGFLIDADRGYVMTAFHVVQSGFISQSSVRITATSTALPDEVLQLIPIKALNLPQDVALLQITNLEVLRKGNIRALDIATHFPPTTHYVTIGYPRGKMDPNKQTAELQGRYEGDAAHEPNYYVEIKQDIDDGSSGSPLIDDNGAVVAICVAKLHNYSSGIYTPLVYAEDLLRSIPPDPQVSALSQEARSRDAGSGKSIRRLIQKLKWRTGNPSNLQLYEWANQIGNDSDQAWLSSYLSCPMLPAYGDRRLSDTDAVFRLSSRASASIRAQILASTADQELFLGRYESAKQKAEEALVLYTQKGDQWGAAAAQTVAGRASLYLNNLDDASTVLAAVARTSDKRQSARAKLYLAQTSTARGEPRAAIQTVTEVLPDLEGIGDKEGVAWGLGALSEADLKTGNYSLAFVHARASQDQCRAIGNSLCEAAANYTLTQLEGRPSAMAPSKSRGLIASKWTILIAGAFTLILLVYLFKGIYLATMFVIKRLANKSK